MNQNTLFEMGPEPSVPAIPGLQYVPDFLNRDQERKLLYKIDEQEWMTELSRRVQHYGFKYPYSFPHTLEKLGSMPQWVSHLAKRLQAEAEAEKSRSPTVSPNARPAFSH